MYQGFSKDNGAVIGRVGGGPQSVDLADTQDAVGAEESMIGCDENGYEVAMTAQLNPENGEVAWIPSYDTDRSKFRTVAMSQMTSMLRDNDRNRIYESAIQLCLTSFIQKTQQQPFVIDIGSGTGLLSLFCTKHGARFTYAIEMFDTMAQIAQETVGQVVSPDQVMVVNAKSTEIEEIPVKVDILVSELLDSSLLGESCIPSHVDTINRFMKPHGAGPEDSIIPIEDRVIPNRAEVFATLVQSEEIYAMVATKHIVNGREAFNVNRNAFAAQCNGGWPTMPVHWEALEHRGAKKISTATACLQIKFWQDIYADAFTVVYQDGEPVQFKTYDSDLTVEEDGVVHGVLLWWKTYLLSTNLDPTASLFYSTEPGAQNWQDHWQQSIFPLPEPIACKKGDIIRLHVSHDELSIWLTAEKFFDVTKSSGMKRKIQENIGSNLNMIVPRHIIDERFARKPCTCGWHLLCGSDRLMRTNNLSYATVWDRVMYKVVDRLAARRQEAPLLMDLSDGSILSLTSGMKSKKHGLSGADLKIVSRERKVFSSLFFSQLMEVNELDDRMMVWDGRDLLDVLHYFSAGDEFADIQDEATKQLALATHMKIHALVSDCYYYQLHALPTWQAISFHYERTALSSFLHPEAIIVPRAAVLMILPLELTDLRNCYGLVHNVCGFDHSPLDQRQQNWHEYMFPYRLANFRKRALCPPIQVLGLDFYSPIKSIQDVVGQSIVQIAGQCDGFAIWMDYVLDAEEDSMKFWNGSDFPAFMTQNIRFLPQAKQVKPGDRVLINVNFEVGQSDFSYAFNFMDA